jgi:uncharacterized RmlC-like cupin family protein
MQISLKTTTILSTLAILALSGATVNASDKAAVAVKPAPVVIKSGDVKYNFAPGQTSGIQFSVLQGDGTKAEAITTRLKWPACFVQLAHSNPYDLALTVLSGEMNFFFGDKLDKSKAVVLKPGDFLLLPANTIHINWASSETVITISATGPRKTVFLNPAEQEALNKAGNNKCPS